MKRCSKCGEEKPHGEFHKDKSKRDGLGSQCAACGAERRRQWVAENREKTNEANRRWYERNREKSLEASRRYYAENREALSEAHRRQYEENREAYRAAARRYREENRAYTRAADSERSRRTREYVATKATRRGRFTPAEDAIVASPDYSLREAALLLERTLPSVETRRRVLRRQAKDNAA